METLVRVIETLNDMVLKGLTTRDNDLLVTVGIVVVHSEKIEVKDMYSDIPLGGNHCLV